MKCETCNGPTWDNRSKKASGEFNPKSPDFSCKDKSCGWAYWLPREKPPESTNEGHRAPSMERSERMDESPSNFKQVKATMQQPDRLDGLAQQAFEARKVFLKAWSEATEVMEDLMPEKDAESMDVKDWYDLKMRVAQFIAIQTQRNL